MSDIKLSENALPAEFQISKFYIPRKRLEKVPREKKYRNLKNSSMAINRKVEGYPFQANELREVAKVQNVDLP